ncbi:MAG: 2-iminoacetate synthase ThiH [Clostridiales bacterium]
MNFYDEYNKYKNIEIDDYIGSLSENKVLNILNKDVIDKYDFLALLSAKSDKHIEYMAKKANKLTRNHFGKVILLYTPMYISNYCVNQCVYCSYNAKNNIAREKLDFNEIEKEAKIISDKGFRHILILTGESRKHSPLDYIKNSVKILKKYFDSISIEIYPLEESEYKILIDSGVDGLTIYQEVYNEDVYDKLHLGGPKKNYLFRIDAPERACRSNIRSVNIGALLGLDNWIREAFFTGLHANYLQNKYLDTEISVSIPRIRPYKGSFQSEFEVSDRELVKTILAFRIFMPRVGISLSTRENSKLRDNLVGLGITKMSADSSTKVGGHSTQSKDVGQFDISDDRNVNKIKEMLNEKGYQAIFKDWQYI